MDPVNDAIKAAMIISNTIIVHCRDRASEVVKRLRGQVTSSHGGKYVYRRKGLLDEVPHRRLIRGVVIVRTEDAGRVVRLLEELGAEVHTRRVELTREDRDHLRGRPPPVPPPGYGAFRANRAGRGSA